MRRRSELAAELRPKLGLQAQAIQETILAPCTALQDSAAFAALNALSESATSDAPHPLQIKAWREMGGSGRSELAAELRRQVRGWKRDALRAQHPDWPDARVEQELARIYLRATT